MQRHSKLIAIALSILIVISFGAHYRAQQIKWNNLSAAVKEKVGAFKGEAFIVIKDLRWGRTIKINEKKVVPSASLVKVPIMAACFKASDEGAIGLEEPLELKRRDKVGGSGILKNERSGTSFSVRQLIDLMIIISDNTATNMLINLLGYEYLNTSFKEFGLRATNISRLMMDMRARSNGIENYTTADDTALMFEKIYRKQLVSRGASFACLQILEEQKSRNRIPAKLPPDTVVAHKTGLEKGVCHDAGIVFTGKGNFLICVLTRHRNRNASRSKQLISDIALMVYDYYTK